MSKIDIRLLYQKENGGQLETIVKLMDNPQTTIQVECDCPECDTAFSVEEGVHADSDLLIYTRWLEEQLEAALSVGERLLISHNNLLQNEESNQNPGNG